MQQGLMSQQGACFCLAWDQQPHADLQELMVAYRKTPAHNWVSELRDAVMGDAGKAGQKGQLRRRDPIAIRIYRDIPVPIWRIVFPDKLLQFRPLDGLRADLFSMAGAPPIAC